MLLVKRKIVFIACLLMFVVAAQGKDTLRISLNEAVRIALDQNMTIKVADNEIRRVNYANKERRAALIPSLSFSGAYQRALKKQRMFFDIPGFPPNPDGIEVGQDNTFNLGLNFQVPIIAPTLWATQRLSDTDLEMAYESARSSKQSLVNQVTKAYYGVLMAKDSYKVFERSYKNTADNARIIADKYRLGSVSEFEWIRADVQARNALSNLVSAESAIELSKLQLKMLMGIDMFADIDVQGELAELETQMYGEALTAKAMEIDNNTDLKQFDIRTKQLQQSLQIHRSQLLPTLAAGVNAQFMSMANDDVALSAYNWFPTSTAQFSLSIPIFQGGAKHYKSKQLHVQLQTMDYQKDNLRRSIELQSISLIDNMTKALEKMASNKKALLQAEKALNIAQKMYEVGAGTFLDVSNSELAYIQSGLAYNQSIFYFVSAKADLEKLLGTELVK